MDKNKKAPEGERKDNYDYSLFGRIPTVDEINAISIGSIVYVYDSTDPYSLI